MKLGQKMISADGSRKGELVRIVAGVPVCRDADGNTFVGKSPRGRNRGRSACVRVKDHDGTLLSGWLDARAYAGGLYRIISPDPIWRGAELDSKAVEVRDA